MAQEAVGEIDAAVFSKRISPYFNWLESRIESGWMQNESVLKDVLKETREIATNMRARFILGVSKAGFGEEVRRTLELFELAYDAFPSETEEIKAKVELFCKGIIEELGVDSLPATYRTQKSAALEEPKMKVAPEAPKIVKEKVSKVIEVKKEKSVEKLIQKVEPKKIAVAQESQIKKIEKPVKQKKIEKSSVEKAEKVKKQVKQVEKKSEEKSQPKKPKSSAFNRFVRFMITRGSF